MKWSLRIIRIAGIDVFMHVTFLILLGWVAISHYLPRHDWGDVVSGLVFIVALFSIVVLHELGHALTARRFGIRTRDITLLPIGGVARLERMPDDPRQELLVAVAGPAVNVALAIGLFFVLLVFSGFGELTKIQLVGGDFLTKMLMVNVVLAAFNMLPAFPMDGGRVLRAVLAMRMDYERATQLAANVGQAMALVFGFVGLFTNPFLVFIALFVWMGASGEASMVQMKSALGGIPVRRAMITDFRTLAPGDSLDRGIEHILAGFQQDFPVLDQERVVGVLTRDALVKALAHNRTARVEEAMQREFETAEAGEMLEGALVRLQSCDCHALPVLQDGRLVGILTPDNVGEFMMIQAAVRGRPARSRR